MPVPPLLGRLFNILNCIFCICFFCIFCPVQLQMIVFDFKEEGTGTEHVAIATSKCVPSGIFRKAQHPCQVNIIASLLAEIFLILCHTTVYCTCATDDVTIG